MIYGVFKIFFYRDYSLWGLRTPAFRPFMSAGCACKVGIKNEDWPGSFGLLFTSTVLPHLLFQLQVSIAAVSAVLGDEAEEKQQIQNRCQIHDERNGSLFCRELVKLHPKVEKRVDEHQEGYHCVTDELFGRLKWSFINVGSPMRSNRMSSTNLWCQRSQEQVCAGISVDGVTDYVESQVGNRNVQEGILEHQIVRIFVRSWESEEFLQRVRLEKLVSDGEGFEKLFTHNLKEAEALEKAFVARSEGTKAAHRREECLMMHNKFDEERKVRLLI